MFNGKSMRINFTYFVILTGLLQLFLSINNKVIAQSKAAWKELVAGIAPSDPTRMDHLVTVISSITGVKCTGFCEPHKCLLLLFDPSLYTQPGMLTDSLALHKIVIYPKANTTFKMMESECTVSMSVPIHQE